MLDMAKLRATNANTYGHFRDQYHDPEYTRSISYLVYSLLRFDGLWEIVNTDCEVGEAGLRENKAYLWLCLLHICLP